jgi:uncharacterized protein (TIGR00369 family)
LDQNSPPPGFIRLEIAAGFAADFGPIYAKRDGERVWCGFRVEERHLNFRDIAHGGAIATFADMQFAVLMRAGAMEPKQAPTISLSIDILAASRLGDWVQGEVTLVKRTGRLAFTQTVLTVEDAVIARTNAMYAYSYKAASLDAPPPFPPAPPEIPPPQGYRRIDAGPGFGDLFGPVYYDAESQRLGFRVARQHINLFGRCHGGVVATFADYQIAPLRQSGIVTGPFAPTLSLNVDFLSPALIGEWVELEATLVRATARYLFTQALISNAAGPVARTTGIYAMTRG